MKTNFLVALILGLCMQLSAQKTIENPFVEASNAGSYTITKIILGEDETTMECSYKSPSSQWFSIPKGTYIQENDSEEKLHITGISAPHKLDKKMYTGDDGFISFSITFPPVSKDAKSLDYVEGNKGGTWALYGIALVDVRALDYLPNAYYGSWLLADGSNKWHISFLKDMVIYEGNWNKEFSCEAVKEGGYELKMDGQILYLDMQDGNLQVGDDKSHLQACIRKKQYNASYTPPVEHLPEMKFGMDTAVFSGCLTNYSPKLGKTGTLYINNLLTGKQMPQVVEINANGSFSVKVPLYHPQSVFARFPSATFSPVLVPGKEAKLYYNGGDVHYLGENAELNTVMNKMTYIRSFNYSKVRKNIEEMSQEDYIAYCDECYAKDKSNLARQAEKFKFSSEIKDLADQILLLRHMDCVMSYNQHKSSIAYKYKKEDKVYEYEKLDPKYYSILNDIHWDDMHLLLGTSFSSHINGLMFSELLRPRGTRTNMDDVFSYMETLEGALSPEELKTIEGYNAFQDLDLVKERTALTTEHQEEIRNLQIKYSDFVQSVSKDFKGVDFYSELAKQINADDEIKMTKDEKSLLKELSMSPKEAARLLKLRDEYYDQDAYMVIVSECSDYYSLVHQNKAKTIREHALDSILTMDHQFLADIMNSQGICPSPSKPMPLTDIQKQVVEKIIKTPEIKEYIKLADEWAIAKIEANKTATGFNVNKVPETKGEELFDALIAPFKGKVVYVDFWATWCGPCLGGMTKVKPLKEELKDNKDIVFLYITNESSPEDTWNAMIPDIKGEHYRLSRDDWNYISSQFGISGIPHYMLVNKKGEVAVNDRSIDPHHGIKETLLKYAAE